MRQAGSMETNAPTAGESPSLLARAVVKIGFQAAQGRVEEMLAAMRSFGTREVHLTHVRPAGSRPLSAKRSARLGQLQEHARSLGLQAETHLLHGHPPSRINAVAWQLEADYIAIPWVHKPVLAQALLGSIDEDVVRTSDSPVFIFSRSLLGRTERLESVLYATDFQSSDRTVMPYLKDRNFEARTLHLLHVGDRAPDPATDRRRREEVLAHLHRLAAECSHAYEQVVPMETLGTTRTQIVRKARELSVDLVVVGRSGKTGMMERFIGSTAEYLPHKSPCSVFIIPAAEQPEKP